MTTPKIERLIVKYLTKSATADDLDILHEWIEHPENRSVFKDYVQTHYAINHHMNQPDSEKALERLLSTIRKEKSVVYKLKKHSVFKYAAAAVLVIALASTYFLKDIWSSNPTESPAPQMVNTPIAPGIDKATLTLGDGTLVTLEKGTTYQTQNANSNGEEIIYNNTSSRTLVYNYLTIPRGGQFQMTLSDGTKVWLNSETQLKYPVSFTDGESRQVELVYGEAYFEVSPSTKHKGAHFEVLNSNQTVEVLGTKFNIKAYKDETTVYTTLVEGKVAVITATQNKLLAPNQQASTHTANDGSIMIKDIKAANEIAWIHGDFIFEGKSLQDIMKVLSRWYDVDATFENEALANVKFNGQLSKHQNLEKLLELIKNTNTINDYEIQNKTLILK